MLHGRTLAMLAHSHENHCKDNSARDLNTDPRPQAPTDTETNFKTDSAPQRQTETDRGVRTSSLLLRLSMAEAERINKKYSGLVERLVMAAVEGIVCNTP
jgi:hypothetical protein